MEERKIASVCVCPPNDEADPLLSPRYCEAAELKSVDSRQPRDVRRRWLAKKTYTISGCARNGSSRLPGPLLHSKGLCYLEKQVAYISELIGRRAERQSSHRSKPVQKARTQECGFVVPLFWQGVLSFRPITCRSRPHCRWPCWALSGHGVDADIFLRLAPVNLLLV